MLNIKQSSQLKRQHKQNTTYIQETKEIIKTKQPLKTKSNYYANPPTIPYTGNLKACIN